MESSSAPNVDALDAQVCFEENLHGRPSHGCPCTNDGEPSTAPGSVTSEQFSPVSCLSNPLGSEMCLSVLAAQCLRELASYRRGEPCTGSYGLELLRRATLQGDREAWSWVQQCFGGVVRVWLRRHRKRDAACRLE